MSRFKIVPKTREQLDRLAFPEQSRQPEAVPYVFYDTQLYTSGTTVQLTFFAGTQTDRSLSNMEAAGALPDPQYFEVQFFGCDILCDASLAGASTEVGALDDLQKLLLVSRSRFTFTMSNKTYGPIPLSFLHASGGATGAMAGTMTAPNMVQVANNGIFDGGYYVGGSIVIPPKVGFGMVLDFSGAQTLNAGNTYIRLWMHGQLNRRVL